MDDLIVSGLRIDWNMLTDSYVSRIPSLRSIDELEFHKNVTFLVGENGSGKSTLLEGIAVACGFNAEGGTRNYRFSTYDDTSDLAKAMTIYRQYAIGPSSFFLRAESYFTLATQAREYDHGGGLARLHEMSHGEGFLEILLSHTGKGLYLMDEPESALDTAAIDSAGAHVPNGKRRIAIHRRDPFADSARSAGCGNPVIRRKRRPSLRL